MQNISNSFTARLLSTRQLKEERVKKNELNNFAYEARPNSLNRIMLPLDHLHMIRRSVHYHSNKTNRSSYQRNIPRSEYPKQKALISWLNPNNTCRVATCFAACAVSINLTTSEYLNKNKGLFEQGVRDATLSRFALARSSCTRYREVMNAWLRPKVLEFLLAWHSAIQKCVNHMMNTNQTLEWHLIV